MTAALPSNVFPIERQRLIARGVVATCPHCLQCTFIRNSRLVTRIYRETWGACLKCGFKGKGHFGWDMEVLPSLMPHPEVQLLRLNYRDAVEQFAAAELFRRDQMDLFVASG